MLLDLSVPLNEQTPTYPGDPKVKIAPNAVHGNAEDGADGYEDHYISVGTHVGTHIDAPSHMIPGGKTLDQYPISHFIGRGRYIRVKDKQFSLADVKGADIAAGDIVLFHTGLSDLYGKPEYFTDYPDLPADIAAYLIERKVKIIGVDMCSPDHEPFPIHRQLLPADVLIIENLTNLEQLVGKEFTVTALPLKMDIDAGLARVVAGVIV